MHHTHGKHWFRFGLVVLAGLSLSAARAGAAVVTYYQTGFENPPFVLGNLNGQDSWEQLDGTATGNPTMVIENTVANGGTQALGITTHGNTGSEFTDFSYAVPDKVAQNSPADQVATGAPLVNIRWDMRVDAATTRSTGWGLDVFDKQPGNSQTLAVSIDRAISQGLPSMYGTTASGDPSNPVFLGNGAADNTFGTYLLQLNYQTRKYQLFLNGSPVGAPQDIATAANNGIDIDFHVVGRGQDTAYFDNLVVTAGPVPEPATVGVLLLMGGGLMLSRRRSTKS
jgi:hypothetical protein